MATILVVDDNPTNREYLVTLLVYQGHLPLEASNGQAGLAVAREKHPDLIITDLIMPVMDGYEFARQVRDDPNINDTPIVFFTASFILAETRKLAEACGVSHILVKPVEPQTVLDTVEAALAFQQPLAPSPSEEFHQEHMRVLTDKLAAKVEELELEIAARKRAEQRLAASEKRFRALVEKSTDGIALVNAEGISLYESPAITQLLGYLPEERVGRYSVELIHPDDLLKNAAIFAQLSQTPGATATSQFRFQHKDGTWRWVEATGSNCLEESGIEAIVVNYRDITEHVQSEEKLRLSDEILQRVKTLVFVADSQSQIVYVSPAAQAILGYEPAELLGSSWWELSRTEATDTEREREYVGRAARGEIPITDEAYERVILARDGQPHTIVWQDVKGPNDSLIGVGHDITERKAAEDALAASEKRFRALIENAPDGIALLGIDGRLRQLTPSTQRILGYASEEAGSQDSAERTHPDDLPDLLAMLNELIQNPRNIFTMEYRFRHKDGSWRWLESTISNLLNEPSVEAIVFNYRDITERKQMESEHQQHLDELAALYRASAPLIAVSSDLTQLGEEIVQAVTKEFALADCGLLLVDEARNELKRLARAGDYHVKTTSSLPLDGQGLTIAAFNAGEVIYASDVSADPRYIANVSQTRSELAIPLRVGEWIIGVLDLQSPEINAFDERARRIVSAFAERAALALENALLLGKTQQHVEELEAIAQVSAALRITSTRTEMFPVILDQLLDVLKADADTLFILHAPTGELVAELGRGTWAPHTGFRVPSGAGRAGVVMSTGQPYVSNEPHTDSQLYHPDILDGINAIACVPLIAQQEAIGLIWIGRKEAITETDVRLLLSIADMAANAIQRAGFFEKTQTHLQHLLALRSIDNAITTSLDLRLTLRVLLDQVATQLGVDAAAVLLYSPQAYTLEYAAGRGFRSRTIERTYLRLGHGYAGRVALEHRTIRLPNLAEVEPDLAHVALYPEEGFRAYFGVPLIAKGMVQGVLEIFHRSPLTPDPDWENFLDALAGQTAIAIENAQLFNKLQNSNMQLIMAYDATIEGWSRALDLRDKETEGHSQRVTDMTMKLAFTIGGFAETELVPIRRGALLHDIGKMGIPDAILLKAGPLTDEEWMIMRKHPTYARELLMPIAYLRPALDIPYCHHEKWDGTGYPQRLISEQIPLSARLFAVVDVWDALTSDRPYRTAWTKERALAYIQEQAGKHFDPRVVEAFLRLVSE